ncbi:MAG TPA: SRPBCC family protein [Candidatus Angelobacter sp.]|nr:SRPBCC family protein [Candidatus Angelobacter sp.]
MGRFSNKDFFVDPDIRKAESLPDSAFNDPDFLELELDTIFKDSWMLVPHGATGSSTSLGDLLGKPGSRVPFSLLGKPLFLQRNSRKEINCFPNVCTHAWHPLVESASIGGSIVCPQHGREFDPDGKFVSHKGFEKLENFPRESDNLRRLHVENWGPLISICLGEPLAPLRKMIEKVKESIPGIDLDSLKYQPVANEVREVDGNWKQHAWNYMDNYHIRFVHKGPGGLAGAIDLETYTTELYEYSALQWAYARRREDGFDEQQVAARFRDPKRDRRVLALWWFIFPNLTLNFYPWGLSVNQYLPARGRPDRTEFHWLLYSIDDAKFEQRNKIWLNEQVDAEDIEAISLVSKGAQSGFAPRGRFAPREELGPHWLHRLIYTTVFRES